MSDDPALQERIALFKAYLKERGLKLTAQRGIIAKKVFSTRRHFSAEELLQELRAERRAVSKATVYRTLALLQESDLLSSIDFERGYSFYEPTRLEGHERLEHIVCVECHKMIEFRDPELETFPARIAARLGFEALSHSYKIFGRCSECRRRA